MMLFDDRFVLQNLTLGAGVINKGIIAKRELASAVDPSHKILLEIYVFIDGIVVEFRVVELVFGELLIGVVKELKDADSRWYVVIAM